MYAICDVEKSLKFKYNSNFTRFKLITEAIFFA